MNQDGSSPTKTDDVDLLQILQTEVLESPDDWKETHCGKTANKIVEFFQQKKLIEKIDNYSNDFDFFIKSNFGQKLFAKSGEHHLLFFLNLVEGAHVLIIEKKVDENECWLRIFQSWQNQFGLTQWLGINDFNCKDKLLIHDFQQFGKAKKVSADEILKFLICLISSFAVRIEQFRILGLAIPWEIQAMVYKVL